MRSRDNIFLKSNYDTQLEELLESKNFNDEAKSLILNILYKIDISYKDYSKIKYSVKLKNDIISEIINIIQNNCNSIEIINPKSKKIKNYVDKKAKTIKTFPNETPLLQALYYISTKDTNSISNVINKIVTKTINKGKAIDGIEIIRDFNGWSWNNAIEDNMSKFYNLIYQSLIFLIGSSGVELAIKSKNTRQSVFDQLQQVYGEKKASEIVKKLELCCMLIYIRNSKDKQQEVLNYLTRLEKKLKIIDNKPQYIAKITKKNNDSLKVVGKIENILKNDELLQKKYLKPQIKEKYKMIDNYKKYLISVQKQRLKQINKNSNLINPFEYIKTKNKLESDIELLKSVKRVYNKRDVVNNSIVDLQRCVISSLLKKIEISDIRKELVNIVYEIRYYGFLPVINDKKIKDVKELEVELRNVKKKLISKLCDLKIIERFSKDEEKNYQILEYIFNTKTTNMNKIFVKLKYKDKKLYMEYYDEDALEIEKDINFSKDDFNELSKKMDKKIKIFI